MPNTNIDFDSIDPRSAANLAKYSDVAIVFASQWMSEGIDVPSLALPDKQDALIEQVAAANPRTVVVLETGSAVTMPWLDRVAGVAEAWFAGSAGHKALANVLVGEVNPSGKLPLSFPATESDVPRPTIARPGPQQAGDETHPGAAHYAVRYDEGAAVGYKWFEEQRKKPLFAFGFGLSYTTYAYSGLTVDSSTRTVHFTVRNTGKLPGTEIAEVYARRPNGSDEPWKQLVGWKRIALAPGESQTIDVRALESFREASSDWSFSPGDYEMAVGPSSDNLPLIGGLHVH